MLSSRSRSCCSSPFTYHSLTCDPLVRPISPNITTTIANLALILLHHIRYIIIATSTNSSCNFQQHTLSTESKFHISHDYDVKQYATFIQPYSPIRQQPAVQVPGAKILEFRVHPQATITEDNRQNRRFPITQTATTAVGIAFQPHQLFNLQQAAFFQLPTPSTCTPIHTHMCAGRRRWEKVKKQNIIILIYDYPIPKNYLKFLKIHHQLSPQPLK